jgi:hypothetical protein
MNTQGRLFRFAYLSSEYTEYVSIKLGIQIILKYKPDRTEIVFYRFCSNWLIINYVLYSRACLKRNLDIRETCL